MNVKIKPLIFNAKKYNIYQLLKKLPVINYFDLYKSQLEDLFLITHPKYKFVKNYKDDFKKFLKKRNPEKEGNFVFFPWNKTLVHILEEKLFYKVITARNKYLITNEEQKKFYNAHIGIAGLSVGSHAALTIIMCGGGKFLRLADNDEISLSNLNRLRYPITSLGENKAIFAAKQIYEMNPYSKIFLYPEGINERNIEKFLLKPKKLDVLIEEMDDLRFKIKIREFAKKYKIPVIMGTDHADNILIDIERYDLDPRYPILHGLLGKFNSDKIKNLSPKEFLKLTGKIAGANLATPRMLYSVLEVGKTIYSWPQLGNAATLCGAIITYLTRKIALKEEIPSGRILVNVDKIFKLIPKNFEEERKKFLYKFKKL